MLAPIPVELPLSNSSTPSSVTTNALFEFQPPFCGFGNSRVGVMIA